MTAYSTAVGPSSRFRKVTTLFNMSNTPIGETLERTARPFRTNPVAACPDRFGCIAWPTCLAGTVLSKALLVPKKLCSLKINDTVRLFRGSGNAARVGGVPVSSPVPCLSRSTLVQFDVVKHGLRSGADGGNRPDANHNDRCQHDGILDRRWTMFLLQKAQYFAFQGPKHLISPYSSANKVVSGLVNCRGENIRNVRTLLRDTGEGIFRGPHDALRQGVFGLGGTKPRLIGLGRFAGEVVAGGWTVEPLTPQT